MVKVVIALRISKSIIYDGGRVEVRGGMSVLLEHKPGAK